MVPDRFELPLASFRGPDTTVCFRLAAAELGEDAVALRTVIHRDDEPSRRAEIVAAPAEAIERFRVRLTPRPLLRPDPAAPRTRPLTIALVGPTGAGKSSTIGRLAAHQEAFGGWRVGVVALDTRPGALESLQAQSRTAGFQLEAVYEPAHVTGALRRLAKSRCDVVLVDTPGQSPRADALAQRWTAAFRALDAHEVHLVLPATHRADLVAALRLQSATLGVTHALFTKLDEVPGGNGLTELAVEAALPTRWVTDGQNAADLRPAVTRILGLLGAPATVERAVKLVDNTRAGTPEGSVALLPQAAAAPSRAGGFSLFSRRLSLVGSR